MISFAKSDSVSHINNRETTTQDKGKLDVKRV